ncbi:NAD(P)-binding protein [Trematosphaeria pertusa]|uniref:NAD(P)-binding protein n=1 Tax=Trematosphaeria pertusa TaxID=390896 RepID=A0A6A6HSG2_9PLEO|nr:NAD(P)-binding protein [Trematosphaeria pertusa]KAF2240370.1 NAD(P)-binding protein [Trematosphaeria pertusa]
MTKLICVIGATGNQGGSVARRFAQDPDYKVRGITRNPSSEAAQALVSEGIDVVAADLDDPPSLAAAFEGANLIFSVTNYWEPFFRPDCRQKAAEQGISCRRYAYDVEYRQGKNIADAAATVVDSLVENGFLVSTLIHAGKASRGKFKELYHFDAKADIFPEYVEEKYPKLAKKMSCVHTGYFMTSYRILPECYFAKQADGSFQTRFATVPNEPTFHLDVNTDTGPFVYAVAQMPPGKTYMACGTICSWTDFSATWSRVTGVPASYKQVTREEMMEAVPDRMLAEETTDMFEYTSELGYAGGAEVLLAEDLRKAGIECPMTSLEDWMKKHDWSDVLNK